MKKTFFKHILTHSRIKIVSISKMYKTVLKEELNTKIPKDLVAPHIFHTSSHHKGFHSGIYTIIFESSVAL